MLNSLAMSKYTLEHVIKRTRDESEDVRKCAYNVLAKKVPFDRLSVEQRISILKAGLTDRFSINTGVFLFHTNFLFFKGIIR